MGGLKLILCFSEKNERIFVPVRCQSRWTYKVIDKLLTFACQFCPRLWIRAMIKMRSFLDSHISYSVRECCFLFYDSLSSLLLEWWVDDSLRHLERCYVSYQINKIHISTTWVPKNFSKCGNMLEWQPLCHSWRWLTCKRPRIVQAEWLRSQMIVNDEEIVY